MKEKIKTISKYLCNILSMINALLLGLNQVWNIPYVDKITATIIVITGVCGAYLTSGKLFETPQENEYDEDLLKERE